MSISEPCKLLLMDMSCNIFIARWDMYISTATLLIKALFVLGKTDALYLSTSDMEQ